MKEEPNYFEFWKKQLGKKVKIFTNDGKNYEGTLESILTSHMNVVMETEEKHLAFRGQVINHIEIPKDDKNE